VFVAARDPIRVIPAATLPLEQLPLFDLVHRGSHSQPFCIDTNASSIANLSTPDYNFFGYKPCI
jgi:hypothetical protein